MDWKFEDPRTIFLHARHPGDALWVDGIRIFAKNLSNRPLTNLRAVVRSYQAGRAMTMNLVLDDRQLNGNEPQTVPAGSEFSLLYIIPSVLGDRASGMPAAQIVPAFGDLNFTFRYDPNQMFARLVSAPEIEQQLLRIERRRRQGDRSKDEQIENGGLCLRRRDALPVVAARKERELLGVLEGQK